MQPVSRSDERGTPIDQWYSDAFLRRQAGLSGYVAGDLAGRILEIVAPGPERVGALADRLADHGTLGDVTRVDLAEALSDRLASERFDALVCALSLHYAMDLEASVHALSRLVRPGGVLLATVPMIGPLSNAGPDWPQRWHLTPLAARRVFESAFPPQHVTVQSFGNVLTATAHLHGLSAARLARHERELHDPDFPVVVAVRARNV
jgi:SAM-dependent methyltransferase